MICVEKKKSRFCNKNRFETLLYYDLWNKINIVVSAEIQFDLVEYSHEKKLFEKKEFNFDLSIRRKIIYSIYIYMKYKLCGFLIVWPNACGWRAILN